MVYQAYTKLKSESTRSMNTKDCAEIADNQKYEGKIFSIRYRLKINDMTRSKSEETVQVKLNRYRI